MNMQKPQKFIWKKQGKIFAPDGRYEWMQSHAQNPSVLILKDRLRVYFTCRPQKDANGNVAAITTFVDLEKDNPGTVLHIHDRPVLSYGDLGTFDQFGVMPGAVVQIDNDVWLYYVGWMRCQGAPYNHAIGLAVSKDNGVTFSRMGRGPLFGRTLREPFLQNSPYVLQEDGLFHMWYSSGIDWLEQEPGVESIYVLMHATSHDGINWERESIPCLEYKVEHECQTNPTVIKIDDKYHMWFCYRYGFNFRNDERGYRIGYAWSDNLISWHREDELGELPLSSEGWDSQMVCYPCVVHVNDKYYMFYSGNYFGRDGFGYAVGIREDSNNEQR
jgi:predicted GH43/DUF377 family glycosyl hydrolase